MKNKTTSLVMLLLFSPTLFAQAQETLGDSLVRELELKEVVVTERKRTSPLHELTVEPRAWESSITYLSADDNKKIGAVNLFDALKYSTNGLPSTQGRRKKHYYLLRGQNVAADYAVNGISLSTNGAGPMAEWVEAPSLLPSSMIESVEVIRSGNSLLLGFSGLNGVVNIKTKTFETFTTQAEVEYGSFNTVRYGALHGGKIGQVNYAVSLFNNRTDGPAGRHSYENLWNLYGKVGYRYRDVVEVKVENFYTYGTRHVTQSVFDSLTSPQSQWADLWEYDPMRYNITTASVRVKESKTASTELQFSYILNRMDLYPDRYDRTSTGKTIVLNTDSIVRARMLDEPDSIFTAALFQAFSPFAGNVIRAGVLYASSANYAHGKSKKEIVSGTLLDQQTMGQWDAHAGVKVIREYYDYYVPGQGFVSDELLAITDKWQPVMLNVSAGLAFRLNRQHTFNFILNSGTLPADKTALQRYLDKNGKVIYETDEPDKPMTTNLLRETRTGIEAGWIQHIHPFGQVTWTLFFLNQKNTTEYTRSHYFDSQGVLRYFLKNINLRTYGIELAFHSPPIGEVFSYSGNVSYKQVHQEEVASRKLYTKQPPLIANVILSLAKKGWEVNVMGKYVSSYKTDRFLRDEVNIGNYFNLDANVTYAIPRAHLEFYGSVVNVFDVRYATVSPIYPDFGRQTKVGVRYSY